jgi:hypothetical protein
VGFEVKAVLAFLVLVRGGCVAAEILFFERNSHNQFRLWLILFTHNLSSGRFLSNILAQLRH